MAFHFSTVSLVFLQIIRECYSTCADIPHGKVAPWCNEIVINKCKYSCDENYKINEKVGTFVTCVWGEWTPYRGPWLKEKLCIPITCPTTLPNGEISENCPATAGTTCEYSCATGYQKKVGVHNITCQPSTRWTADPHFLCTNDQQCNYEEIPNGDLDLACSRIPGEGCTYTCRLGYHASDGSSVVICASNSEWSRPLLSLCKRNLCSRTIPNGIISEHCNLQTGDYCSYACNSGYTKSRLRELLKCNASGQWEWDVWLGSFCDKIPPSTTESQRCPPTIRNGNIALNCNRLPYSRCLYTCHAGCSVQSSNLYCSSSLEWSREFYACYCEDTTEHPISQDIVTTGTVVGIIVGMLVLFLIVLICVWYIRKSKQDQASSYNEPVRYQGSRIAATVPDGQSIGVASPTQTELQRSLLYEPSCLEHGHNRQQQPQTAGSTHIHIPPEFSSAPNAEPSAPPASSAPPPSYEEVICNPSEYKA